MALATNSVAGEIQLTGDLAGDGGSQTGSNPQLTHIAGLTAGQYVNAKITVDEKGRITAIETPSAAEIAARVPVATTSSKGIVQVGDNLYINSSDTAGYQEVSFGGLISAGTDSSGLSADACATYSVTIIVDGGAGNTVEASGSSLQTVQDVIDAINAQVVGATASLSGGNIRITSDTAGRGSIITISNDKLFACMTNFSAISSAVDGTGTCELYAKKATASELGVVKVGSGVNVVNGEISVDLGSIAPATTTTLGTVIVPTNGNIDVDVSGNISVPTATPGAVGVVQIGSGLSVDGSGVVSFNSANLPLATESSVGIVQVGTGLNVAAGVVSLDVSIIPVATELSTGVVRIGNGLDVDVSGIVSVNQSEINLAVATDTTTGVVRIGNGLDVDVSGIVSVNESELSLPNATALAKGIVQIGSNINVASGVISVPDATTGVKGVVQVGDNINVASGVISIPVATNSTLGVVKSANTSNITIDGSGGIDLAVTVPSTSSANVWTGSQSTQKVSLGTTSGTINIDGSLSNVFEVTLNGDATLANMTNNNAGTSYTIIVHQDGTGLHNLTFGSDYKFRFSSVNVDTIANSTTIIHCLVVDGTTALTEILRGY